MFVLPVIALVLVQTQVLPGGFPPFPERSYQPTLLDPGLHGGRPRFVGDQDSTPGDVTPDGRVIVFYRQVWDPDVGIAGLFRSALQVATFDPDAIQVEDQNLEAFYTSGLGSAVIGGETMWGSDYAITPVTDHQDLIDDDAFLVHYSPPTLPGPDPKCPSCPTLDLDYLPAGSANAMLTVALKTLAGHAGGGANPFPSDALGEYDPDGTFRTYELWMVTSHFPVDPDDVTCGNLANTRWQCHVPPGGTVGRWRFRGKGTVLEPILGGVDITVIVDEAAQPPRVHAASAGDFVPLTFPVSGGGTTRIIGTEPTITADGRLLVYHADGGPNVETKGMITYVYNDDPCQPSGWRAPRSITALHEDAHLGSGDADLLRYPLSWFPIRQPASNGTSVHTYTEADTLSGPYPWVDKDGSFLMSAHTFSWEGRITPDDPETPLFDPVNGRATRSSMVAFGAITGGHIKHVDDVALNPTRQGGNIDWPLTGEPEHDAQRDSQMTSFFSTGPKPGLWEPFFGKSIPVPTMQSSARIPVLPVWVHRTRLYGEVRFEEADGDYLLYLACNESLKRNGNPIFSGVVDAQRTPDTSGQATRAVCTLQGGASFPQEVYGTLEIDPGFDPNVLLVHRLNAEALRLALSPEPGLQYHENVGFKGQALLFPTAGSVAVTGGVLFEGTSSPYGAVGSELTAQAFVKALRTWDAQPLQILTDTGHFQLSLRANGRFRAQVTVMHDGVIKTKTVESRPDAIAGQADELDPSAGWRHVAMTFDGDASGKSNLRLYVDGQVEAALNWIGESHFEGPTTDFFVGPDVTGGVADAAQSVLVLDEVAISRVVRGAAEIRRDAFVAPEPSGFESTWPPMADVPIPAEWVEHVSWPEGVAYSADKVALGRDLFSDPILSAPDSRLDTDPLEAISCATCHEVGSGFAEDLQTAGSSDSGFSALFNTPTVLASAFGTHKMFNGRAARLEAQVVLPLISGVEMGVQTMPEVLDRLANSAFDARFNTIYGAGATDETLGEVLAMYQRTLVPVNAPFDASAGFAAFSAEQRGRALFFGKARCSACHRGPAFTDDDFHNIQSVTEASLRDLGDRTGRPTDDGKLKTPTLRNIVSTAPYFHDGSKASLSDVIDHYNGGFLDVVGAVGTADRELLSLELTPSERADLVEFLESLSGSNPQ
jgi:cytochrome c peroxidase